MKFKSSLIWISILAVAVVTVLVGLQTQAAADSDSIAAITKLENDAVKADLAGDKSFYEKNLADDWTGGDSSGFWYTKQSLLKGLSDTKNNKTNSEGMSELKVRAYGDAAVATYRTTYDALVRGEHRSRTVISTDTFVKQNGQWKQVAGHSSQEAILTAARH